MIKGQDMTLDEVNKLVKRVKKENREVEFKTTTAEIHKACRTLCAFLNSRGGIVLIGVKNNGHPIGQMVTDPTCQEIANNIRKIEPSAPVEVSYIPLGEKFVIAMEVPAGDHMPYVFDGRPYYRVENETIIMPQHLYEQLLVKRGQLNHSWEEFVSDEYSIDDLDHDEIYKMVKHGIEAGRVPDDAMNESVSDILSSLELMKNDKLINAAIILFAKKVTPIYPQCMIKMARFRGLNESEDFLDNQQFHGNAFKIMEEANAFMRKHLSIAGFYQSDSFVRVDKPTLPVLVVREALINAICHKDYNQRSSAITLAIFDNRMELWNNGTLPRELKIEDLKIKHKSYPRNKLMAKTFFKKGLIETWGTGTTKMVERCREHGNPDPVFEEYSGGISVQFLFPEPIQRIGSSNVVKQKEVVVPLSKRQQEIMFILGQFGELKLAGIIDKLQGQLPERTLRNDLSALRKLGMIGSRGRGGNAVWFKL